MRLFNDTTPAGSPVSRDSLEAAQAAGRARAERVPDTVLFPASGDPKHDLSDTGIFKLVDALESGRAEREVQS